MDLPEPTEEYAKHTLFVRPHVEPANLAEIAGLFGAQCLESWPVTGGMPNVTFKAYTPDGALAIRVCNVGYTTRQHLDFELNVLKYLESIGFEMCPRIVSGLDGEDLQRWRHYPVIATKFIDGRHLESLPLDYSLISAVGKTVGDLTLGLRAMHSPLDEALGYEYRSQRLLRSMASVVKEIAWPIDLKFLHFLWEREIDVLLGRRSLQEMVVSHTDVWPPNLIVTDRGVVLVDFDDVALAPPVMDLASALSEFAIDDLGNADVQIAAAMMKGYLSSGHEVLSERSLDELVAGICCSYITWLACDASHGLKFDQSGHYYKRLQHLAEVPTYRRLRAQLGLAILNSGLMN